MHTNLSFGNIILKTVDNGLQNGNRLQLIIY